MTSNPRRKRTNTSNTEVIGVFIGWRGLAIERQWDKTGIGWVARHLSSHSRKHDTDLIAGIPLTKTLYSLASETHDRDGRVFAALFKICKRTIRESPEQKDRHLPATIAAVPN